MSDENENMKRFIAQVEGKANRQYSQGRMSAEDDGDLAIAVGVDPQRKIIIINFGKPVAWIGLGIAETEELIEALKDKIDKLKVQG